MKTILRTLALSSLVCLGFFGLTSRAEAGGYGFFSASWTDGSTAVRVHLNSCPPPPPRCEPVRVWVPGHYECRRERVCVPGYWTEIRTPAEYGWVRHGCRWVYVEIRPACVKRVWVPERVEWREVKVWVPGRYELVSATGERRPRL